MTGTVTLHRVFKAPAARLYRAFIDADALCKWMPPHGFIAKVHALDARVGGGFKMSFRNFGTGHSHSFGGTYLEMQENALLRYSDQFDDPNLPGQMLVTVRFTPVLCGTELHIVQEGIPDAIPVEFCYLGWQESLVLLAHVAEPDIPDGA